MSVSHRSLGGPRLVDILELAQRREESIKPPLPPGPLDQPREALPGAQRRLESNKERKTLHIARDINRNNLRRSMRRRGIQLDTHEAALLLEQSGDLPGGVEGAELPRKSEVVAPVRLVVEQARHGSVVFRGEGLVQLGHDGLGFLSRVGAADVCGRGVVGDFDVGGPRDAPRVLGELGPEVVGGGAHCCESLLVWREREREYVCVCVRMSSVDELSWSS